MTDGIYIYGILKTSGSEPPGEIVLNNPVVPAVQTVPYKDIAAIFSRRPLIAYDAVAKEKVVQDLAIHQLVLEKLMIRYPIIPVKFGTMVETEEAVSAFLAKGYDLLHKQLDKMEGKIELDIVAWWELPKILPVLSRHNSQLQEEQEKLAQKGASASTEDKIQLGRSIEQALNTEKASYQQLILRTLQPRAEEISAHDPANDEMIFNTAFLLEKQNERLFHMLVDTLDQQLESNVNFRVVGPLPAYSFSTILLQKFDPASIEEAKATLGITGELSDTAIREAYRQLARQYHPDTGNGEEADEFKRVHAAYTTLIQFVENGWIYPEIYQWKHDVQ